MTFMGQRNMIRNSAWPSFLQNKEVWFRFDANCNDHVPKFKLTGKIKHNHVAINYFP